MRHDTYSAVTPPYDGGKEKGALGKLFFFIFFFILLIVFLHIDCMT